MSILHKLESLLTIVPILASFYVLDQKFISVSSSEGASMQPTIVSGDILIIDKFFYKQFGLSKEDIVVATQPVNPLVSICKRIKGVQGDIFYGIRIPSQNYWLQGDNRPKSYDSRNHGCVPENLIKGRVLFILKI